MLRRLCAVAVLVASMPVVFAAPGAADIPSFGVNLPGLAGGDPSITDMVLDHEHDQLDHDRPRRDRRRDPHGHRRVPRHTRSVAGGGEWAGARRQRQPPVVQLDCRRRTRLGRHCRSRERAAGDAHAPGLAVSDELGGRRHGPCLVPLSAVLVSRVAPRGLGVYDPATDQFDLAPTVDTQIADLGDLEVLENNPATADTLVVASDSHTSSVDVATGSVHPDTAHPDGARSVAVTSDGSRYARAGTDVTSAPVADPGSTTGTTVYDSAAMNETAPAQGLRCRPTTHTWRFLRIGHHQFRDRRRRPQLGPTVRNGPRRRRGDGLGRQHRVVATGPVSHVESGALREHDGAPVVHRRVRTDGAQGGCTVVHLQVPPDLSRHPDRRRSDLGAADEPARPHRPHCPIWSRTQDGRAVSCRAPLARRSSTTYLLSYAGDATRMRPTARWRAFFHRHHPSRAPSSDPVAISTAASERAPHPFATG